MRFLPRCCQSGAFATVLISVACFVGIWGVKAATIGAFGSPLPYWDQWAKEGEITFAPYLERGELAKNLLKPHSEHYIAPTLATNLLLVRLTGEWNARTQCLVNAALHAAIGAALIFWILTTIPPPWNGGGVVVTLALLVPPISWENVVGGFQSQFYFLIGFSLLAIHSILRADRIGLCWALGVGSGLLACVSMGSGAFWIGPTFLALLVPALNKGRMYRVVTLAVLTLIGVGAWWTRPLAPWHDPLHAAGGGDFIRYLARCLSWPQHSSAGWGILLWVPLGWLFWREVRRKGATLDRDTMVLLAIGLWSVMQAAAVAYARGAVGSPVSRYGDIFALGLLASFSALLRMLPATAASIRSKTAVAAWVGLCLLLVTLAARQVFVRDLPAWSDRLRAHQATVREFLRTDDMSQLSREPMPFPDPEWLARILRRPSLRAILPGRVIEPDDGPTSKHLRTGGLSIAAMGFALAAFLFVRCVLRGKDARHPVVVSPPS